MNFEWNSEFNKNYILQFISWLLLLFFNQLLISLLQYKLLKQE